MGGCTMLNRREFIKNGFVAMGTLALMPSWAFKSNDLTRLVILHTNDLHCRLEPFSENHPKYPGKGGMNRISAFVKETRKKEPQLLMLDSGDFSQGTPYYNFFGNELIVKMMNEIGFNASTVGNHEFDLGLESLSSALSLANFPLISSNYDFSATPLHSKVKKNLVLERNGLRIGIYGLGIELQGLVDESLYAGTRYLDPLHTALEQENFLREQEKCDFIICLSHLGYQYQQEKICDRDIARQSSFTDLILGGHTHTFLESPVELMNKKGEPVVINQVGWASLMLGQLVFFFEKRKKKIFETAPNKPVG